MTTRLSLILILFPGLTVLCGLTKFSDSKDNLIRQLTDSSYKATILKKMQGTWEETPGTPHPIVIKDSIWNFKDLLAAGQYNDIHTIEMLENDRYFITITNKLPQFADTLVKAEFLVLTSLRNNKDTSYYEILGLTDTTMSLMHYPSAKIQLYTRKK